MNDQTIRFRFGIFLLASLILLASLTILFGGFPSFFRRTDDYTIVFTNAQGVLPGTPVRRSGVNIGEVRTVILDNTTGKVRVDIRVEQKYSLRKGDRPTIMMGLIGGDSSIAFVPPEHEQAGDADQVPPGAELKGVSPLDAGTVLAKTTDLVKPAEETLLEIRKVFQKLDKMSPTLEKTLASLGEVSKMAEKMGPDFSNASKEIAALSRATRETIPDLKKTNEEIQSLVRATRETIPEFKKTNEEIQFAVRGFSKVTERVDVLLRTNEDKINKSIDRTEEALRRVNELFSDENQKNLRDTLRNVRNGTQNFEAISKDAGELIKETRVTVKRADDTFSDLQKVLKPLGEKGPGAINNFNEAAESLNQTLRDVRDLIRVVGRSEGTVQKLLVDPSLYNNLNDSALMATRIMPRLDRIMHDLEIFADKLARHPELIGVRGAIVPSSGVKENPSPPPPSYRVFPLH
jgi:ABC-type transporter Mla subunit MlaD